MNTRVVPKYIIKLIDHQRQTTKWVNDILKRADDHGVVKLYDSGPVRSVEYFIGMLSGVNDTVSTVLMARNLYRGFRYIYFDEEGRYCWVSVEDVSTMSGNYKEYLIDYFI